MRGERNLTPGDSCSAGMYSVNSRFIQEQKKQMSSSNKAIEREQDDNRIGGSISRSLVGRTKDKYRAIGDNDIRTTSVDVMDLSHSKIVTERVQEGRCAQKREKNVRHPLRFEFLNGEAEDLFFNGSKTKIKSDHGWGFTDRRS